MGTQAKAGADLDRLCRLVGVEGHVGAETWEKAADEIEELRRVIATSSRQADAETISRCVKWWAKQREATNLPPGRMRPCH